MEKINVGIIGSGHVFCRSKFYTVADILPSFSTSILTSGENKMVGEIDSGIWAISYMLSMYGERKEDFCLWEPPRLMINDKEVSISEFCEEACYMDTIYSLFSSTKTVEELVKEGIKKTGKTKTDQEIREMFYISPDRFERPICNTGNEFFQAMAAVGYCHGKKIFCFPWLSRKRYTYYCVHLAKLINVLEKLNMIIVMPVGKE